MPPENWTASSRMRPQVLKPDALLMSFSLSLGNGLVLK